MMRFILVLALLAVMWPVSAREKEGGIIGTGVLGQITRLGSIYVNGLHIRFAPGMDLVGIDSTDALSPGMTVAASVRATDTGWQATALRRLPVLSGPVTGPAEVMGVPVTGAALVALPRGGHVRVDGFWSENGVEATHVEPVERGDALVTGPYLGDGMVGNLRFTGITPQHLDRGDIIQLTGRYADGALAAVTLDHGVFAGPRPDLVLAEGYLSAPDARGQYRLIGANLVAYTDQPGMVDTGQKVLRCAWQGQMGFAPDALTAPERELAARLCPER
ncbi:MAG: hypothetical protein OIF40_10950 [Mangrovicoccus sp.]|nr:hypothetical protein [Mangrovicoccus sp.]